MDTAVSAARTNPMHASFARTDDTHFCTELVRYRYLTYQVQIPVLVLYKYLVSIPVELYQLTSVLMHLPIVEPIVHVNPE